MRKIGNLQNESTGWLQIPGASVQLNAHLCLLVFHQTLTFSVDCFQDALPSVCRTEGESPRSGVLRLIR